MTDEDAQRRKFRKKLAEIDKMLSKPVKSSETARKIAQEWMKHIE